MVDRPLKVLLQGDGGSGKTSLLVRHALGSFADVHIPTIGIDFRVTPMDVNGVEVKLQIWDLAGKERFRSVTSTYYRKVSGILLCYDITDKSSFNNCSQWLQEINKFIAIEDVTIMLIGTKNDLEGSRQVSLQEAQSFAEVAGLQLLETSAKNDVNVTEAFECLAQNILQRIDPPPIAFTVVSVEPPDIPTQVTLTTLAGEMFQAELGMQKTVSEVKRAIAQMRGVKFEAIRILTEDGRILDDVDVIPGVKQTNQRIGCELQ